MLKFASDIFRRKRLRRIVETMPHLLKQYYGGSEFYTANQVKRVAVRMKLKRRLMPSALATACSEKDFIGADSRHGRKLYRTLRREIAKLFWLDEKRLNCRTLTAKFPSSAPYNVLGKNGIDGILLGLSAGIDDLP